MSVRCMPGYALLRSKGNAGVILGQPEVNSKIMIKQIGKQQARNIIATATIKHFYATGRINKNTWYASIYVFNNTH